MNPEAGARRATAPGARLELSRAGGSMRGTGVSVGGGGTIGRPAGLHEGDDDDHAGEQDRDDRVGVTGNIEVVHGFRPFMELDEACRTKV
jgi:hypothetical protein